MVSYEIQVGTWFRTPLPGNMERDALFIDIPVSTCTGNSAAEEARNSIGQSRLGKRYLRLCTTHLESLWEAEGKEFRPRQLAQISALLKAPPTKYVQITGDLVGGDMNHISLLDFSCHKMADIDLFDVWEDISPPPIPELKPFQKDLSYGRAKGNTWGYQSKNAHSRKRLDKFFYTGSVEIMTIPEAQDLAGKIGRLGIGTKTRVGTWEHYSWAPQPLVPRGG